MENKDRSPAKKSEDYVEASFLKIKKKESFNFDYILNLINQKKSKQEAKNRSLVNSIEKLYDQSISIYGHKGPLKKKLFSELNRASIFSLPIFFEKLSKLAELNLIGHLQFFIHEKGKLSATSYYIEKNDIKNFKIPVSKFDELFKGLGKSKTNTFKVKNSNKDIVKASGMFLGHCSTFRHHNLIIISSKNEFLMPSSDQVAIFLDFCHLYSIIVKNLLINDLSNKTTSLISQALRYCPLPLKVTDNSQNVLFDNKKMKEVGQDARPIDVIKVDPNYKLKIYENPYNLLEKDSFHIHRIRLLGELLNTLQHELSNPLFGLSLSSELWISDESHHQTIEILKDIHVSAKRCEEIICNFSNLYNEESSLVFTSIGQIIKNTLILAKSETKSVNLEISYLPLSDDSILIKTNPTWISQILFNLVINSTQAIKQHDSDMKGEIIVTYQHNRSSFCIAVSDNGPGVPQSEIKNIFGAYYTTKSQGNGLGLTICKQLAEKLNGKIHLKNRPKTKGTTFYIDIPIIQ